MHKGLDIKIENPEEIKIYGDLCVNNISLDFSTKLLNATQEPPNKIKIYTEDISDIDCAGIALILTCLENRKNKKKEYQIINTNDKIKLIVNLYLNDNQKEFFND